VDVGLPDMELLDFLEAVRLQSSGTKVIVLSAEVSSEQVLEAMSLGARGVLLKDMAAADLLESVRSVSFGHHCFPVRRRKTIRHHEKASSGSRFSKVLSRREVDVMRLVAEGLTNHQVARRLSLSEGTVKVHLHRIYQKTGISNRTALTLLALGSETSTDE
jgi:two-component system nitrate/nitrite response regulator NarL